MTEKNKKKVAFTVGVFDCLHEGHIALFTRMQEEAERVVVILHDDISTFKNKGRFPVQMCEHRRRNLIACGLVDRVWKTYKPDPSDSILLVVSQEGEAPENCVYIRGDDWQLFPGRQAVEGLGIEIVFKTYTEGVSTSMIRKALRA